MVNPINRWIDMAAAPMGRAYRPWTTLQDIKQHLWSWVYANEQKVADYLTHPDGERIIRSILNQEARNFAIKERAAVSGYNAEDLAWYTPTALRKILPDVFDYEDWQSFSAGSGGRSGNRPANESGDRLVTIIDVKAGLDKLNPGTRALLKEHYGNGTSVEACAIALDIEFEACRKRIQRGVNALSEKLNNPRGANPYEGVTLEEWRNNQRFYDTRTKGRTAMSNAKAQAITEI